MALGVVLAPYGQNPDGTSPPYGVSYSGVNRHQTYGPHDPQFNTRATPGMYYDTPLGKPKRMGWIKRLKLNHQRRLMGLGDIPTDAELAHNYGYTPVQSGWIATVDHRYVTGPWVPPNGQDYSGNPPPIALSGLGQDVTSAPNSVDDVIATMNAHNDRIFALTLVSTTAVAVSAMITIFRSLRLIREDK